MHAEKMRDPLPLTSPLLLPPQVISPRTCLHPLPLPTSPPPPPAFTSTPPPPLPPQVISPSSRLRYAQQGSSDLILRTGSSVLGPGAEQQQGGEGEGTAGGQRQQQLSRLESTMEMDGAFE